MFNGGGELLRNYYKDGRVHSVGKTFDVFFRDDVSFMFFLLNIKGCFPIAQDRADPFANVNDHF